jgi:hypothetical protein
MLRFVMIQGRCTKNKCQSQKNKRLPNQTARCTNRNTFLFVLITLRAFRVQ